MRIALLQGGGTCPASNDAHRGLAQTAEKHGHEVVVVPHGYKGLLTPGIEYQNIHALHETRVLGLHGLYRQPGCAFGTSRTKPLPINEKDESIADPDLFRRNSDLIQENLTRNKIDILGIVGGDDTLARGARRLYTHGVLRRSNGNGKTQTVQAIGVPKTIDNDLDRVALSFGATTAARRGQSFVEDGYAEARNNGKVMVIEAMGRDSGWLAAASAEDADALLIPEMPLSEQHVVARVQELVREKGKHLVLVVAEGFPIDGKKVHVSDEPDAFGHKRLGGVRFRIEDWLNRAGIQTMQLCPGYLFRSGKALHADAQYAHRLGETAMEAALAGKDGVVSYLPEGSTSLDAPLLLMDMGDVKGGKTLPRELYDAERLQLVSPVFLPEE